MADPRQPGRIASLDGLRAISIVLVLASHLDGTRGYPALGVRALRHRLAASARVAVPV